MKSNQTLQIVECVSWREEKNKNVKIRTQNEKMVETDMDVWYQTYKKTFTRVRKKQCNVSSPMNYL